MIGVNGRRTQVPKVLLQPASGSAAREHYRDTIEDPVDLENLAEVLDETDLAALRERYPRGQFYVWGVTKGSSGAGQTRWRKIEEGDVVAFTWDGAVQSTATVTYKTENAKAAEALWGQDDDQRTWRYLYFVTEPQPVSVRYEVFNEAAGYDPKYVPRGFNVLDGDRSAAVLEEIPELHPGGGERQSPDDWPSGLNEAYRLFRQDRLEDLRVKVRRYRAEQVRDLLRTGELDPGTFNREVWQLAAGGETDGEKFADQFEDGVAPTEELLDRIETALDRDELELHGNYHWRPGTRIFGAQFGEERRRRSLQSAFEILNRDDLEPLTKFRGLADVDGFGPSTASGLVMLMHPDVFAVYNAKSQIGLRSLGGAVDTIETFQASAKAFGGQVGAKDFLEFDRFLYLIAEDRIFVPSSAGSWPNVWWVNQGRGFEQGRKGGYVWAPTENRKGTRLRFHENVARLGLGDRLLHYKDGSLRAVGTVVGSPLVRSRPDNFSSRSDSQQGYFARVSYDTLDNPIELNRIPEDWRLDDEQPFNRTGGVKQGYLFPLSEEFARNVVGRFPQIRNRFPVVEIQRADRVSPNPDLEAIVEDFAAKLREAGLRFGSDRDDHDAFVRDFVVSLATKQLVILTGLSGSGKTQIALQFGRWLSGEDDDRYRVVPVRPDWTGPEALFGYEDALQEPADDGRRAWHVPGALEFMLEAAHDPDHPYLMVLDEMNLAHVERYFADVISGMESGEPCLPNLREEEDGTWRTVPGGPEKLPFPDNLFIAGTVNVDETTYMFSPKVLDRANTLEFRVETDDLRADLRRPDDCEPGEPSRVRGFLEIAADEDWHLEHGASDAERFVEHFRDLHRSLEGGFSFGHRVLYEALRFAALHEEAGGDALEDALDLQVLQKILPRVHGSRRRVEPVLRALGRFCWDLEPADGGGGPTDGFDPTDDALDPDEAALPRSFDKVRRMTERLRTNQFVSFTE